MPASASCASVPKMLMSGSLWRRPTSKSLKSCAGRDLHRARALLRVGIFVGDDRDAAADERQDRELADQVLVALVLGMNGHGHVAEHRLGTRGRHGDEAVGHALDGVADVPEVALDLDLLHLEVGDRGLELRVPVHKALVLVDQALLVEVDEDLQHGLRQALVHGEALARPVAGGAEALELAHDGAAGLLLPLPDPLDEFLAAEVAALDLALGELALDDHLRGDAGMVHARLPQHVLAAHALEAAEDVLDRVVEGVPHVERAGHVRRRDDDRVGYGVLAILAAGLEGLGLLPAGGDARFDSGGIERLVHHDEYRPVGATNAQARRLQTGRIGRSQQRDDNLSPGGG